MQISAIDELLHDLRQPLTNIEIYSASLELRLASNPIAVNSLQAIREQVRLISRLLLETRQRYQEPAGSAALTNAASSALV
ncbi:MAG: hypothetical protein FJW37_01460 [Acidobacteria bacterium]|nr:hypothetical protein [Acidobacteriota bacterium]